MHFGSVCCSPPLCQDSTITAHAVSLPFMTPLLTWLYFMPSAGLAATPWGAPLACVKWFFTRTVHFVLHRLEALGRAEKIKIIKRKECIFKSTLSHLSPGCFTGKTCGSRTLCRLLWSGPSSGSGTRSWPMHSSPGFLFSDQVAGTRDRQWLAEVGTLPTHNCDIIMVLKILKPFVVFGKLLLSQAS